jgi:hypothetical protein
MEIEPVDTENVCCIVSHMMLIFWACSDVYVEIVDVVVAFVVKSTKLAGIIHILF